jgi:hypothetical protein
VSRSKRARISERFAMLPLSVMISEAFKTLPAGYQRVLWLLAAQYDGTNNGDLALTRKQAAHFGLNNERHRSNGLRELEARGLIEKTRQGGIAAGTKFPTLWALTFHSIQHREGRKLDAVRLPTNAWRQFQDTHVASSTTRTQLARKGVHDTHPASSEPASTTRTLIAPSENLGPVCRDAPRKMAAKRAIQGGRPSKRAASARSRLEVVDL